MAQKDGKKVGIHFYENVLSEINLPLSAWGNSLFYVSVCIKGSKGHMCVYLKLSNINLRDRQLGNI